MACLAGLAGELTERSATDSMVVGGLKGCWHIKGVPSGQAHGKYFDLLISAIHLGSSLRQKEYPEGQPLRASPALTSGFSLWAMRDLRQLRQAGGPLCPTRVLAGQ